MYLISVAAMSTDHSATFEQARQALLDRIASDLTDPTVKDINYHNVAEALKLIGPGSSSRDRLRQNAPKHPMSFSPTFPEGENASTVSQSAAGARDAATPATAGGVPPKPADPRLRGEDQH